MGKTPRSPQNDKVPEDTERAPRLRPEEILAQTFATHVPLQSSDGWSPKGRRLFLAAMALAGALFLAAGLVLTGELGPGPGGGSTPLESGPNAGALTGALLPDNSQTAATPAPGPTATTAPGLRPRNGGPAVIAPTQNNDPTQPESTPTTVTRGPQPTTPPPPTTTVPCSVLGSRALGAQIPPLCR